MSAVILKDLKEHAKYRKWKQNHMDPRNASRTPSASREPAYRLRYESPIGASPSRQLDHQKPFYDDDPTFDRSTSYRGSVGRSIGNAPSYNGTNLFIKLILFDFLFYSFIQLFFLFSFTVTLNIYNSKKKLAIHSYRSTPKYGLKTSTLPPNIGYRNGYSSVSL